MKRMQLSQTLVSLCGSIKDGERMLPLQLLPEYWEWKYAIHYWTDIFIILITLAIDIAIDEYKRGSVNLVIDPQKMKWE